MLFILPVFERMNSGFIHNILYVILITSVVIGFYAAYSVAMWIDRKLSYSYFGAWMRRAVSGIFIVAGLGLSTVLLLALTLTAVTFMIQTGSLLGATSTVAFSCTIIAFFTGIAFFAGYLEFVFEKKAGILVFIGRQRF
jgi:hypothetical protein